MVPFICSKNTPENRGATVKTSLIHLSLLLLFTGQLTYAKDCSDINCDCESLASKSWKDLCTTRESELNSHCESGSAETLGNCIVHGPSANRPSLVLATETINAEHVKGIKLINHKLAAMYWSTQQDMRFIDRNVATSELVMAEQRLRLMLFNSETLMNIQRQLASLLEESGLEAQIARSWHNFGEQTQQLAHHLLVSSETLIEQSKPDKEEAKLAYEILSAAGDMYEQVAYAYDQSTHEAQAAEAWKKAATISSRLLAMVEKEGNKESIDYYRYQSATRLHRASATSNAKTKQAKK